MIAISETLIRSARHFVDDEGHRHYNKVDDLLSSSPPDLPQIKHLTAVSQTELKAKRQADRGATRGAPKTVNFTAETKLERKSLVYSKVAVGRSVQSVSSLSKQLSDGVVSLDGPSVDLDVFISVGQPPMQVSVPADSRVDTVIELVIQEYHKQYPDVPLDGTYVNYDLRMVDDDDGTPDLDLPPLERSRMIEQIGVQQIALCERMNAAPELPVASRDRRGVSLELNVSKARTKDGRFFLKVHMPNHATYVLPVTVDMKLEDVLPLIAKKRTSADAKILPQHYKFVYLESSNIPDILDMQTPISTVLQQSDELELVHRVAKTELKTATDRAVTDHSIMITPAFANSYSQYPVIKTNQRGRKQRRILGIDGEKIYNKNPDVSGLRLSMDARRVRRAYRLISEVHEVSMRDDKSFTIVYREKNGKFETRDYEAETRTDCATIVNKIKHLKKEANQT